MNVHLPAPRRGWPARLANLAVVVVVLALTAATFVLSYTGVHEIALHAGVSARLARLYPGVFDAVLVVACVAAVMARDARWWVRGYAWLTIIVVVGVVGAADALHAMNVALPLRQTEAVVAAAPWVLVLLGFSLMLTMLRQSRAQHSTATAAAPSRRASRRAAKRAADQPSLPPPLQIEPPAELPRHAAAPPAELPRHTVAPALPAAAIAPAAIAAAMSDEREAQPTLEQSAQAPFAEPPAADNQPPTQAAPTLPTQASPTLAAPTLAAPTPTAAPTLAEPTRAAPTPTHAAPAPAAPIPTLTLAAPTLAAPALAAPTLAEPAYPVPAYPVPAHAEPQAQPTAPGATEDGVSGAYGDQATEHEETVGEDSAAAEEVAAAEETAAEEETPAEEETAALSYTDAPERADWATGHAAADTAAGSGAASQTYPATPWLERVADSGDPGTQHHDYWDTDDEGGLGEKRYQPGQGDRTDDDAQPPRAAAFTTVPRLNRVRATPIPPEEDEE